MHFLTIETTSSSTTCNPMECGEGPEYLFTGLLPIKLNLEYAQGKPDLNPIYNNFIGLPGIRLVTKWFFCGLF